MSIACEREERSEVPQEKDVEGLMRAAVPMQCVADCSLLLSCPALQRPTGMHACCACGRLFVLSKHCVTLMTRACKVRKAALKTLQHVMQGS